MNVKLDCGSVQFDDWKSKDADKLRKLALEQTEKILAEARGQSTYES